MKKVFLIVAISVIFRLFLDFVGASGDQNMIPVFLGLAAGLGWLYSKLSPHLATALKGGNMVEQIGYLIGISFTLLLLLLPYWIIFKKVGFKRARFLLLFLLLVVSALYIDANPIYYGICCQIVLYIVAFSKWTPPPTESSVKSSAVLASLRLPRS